MEDRSMDGMVLNILKDNNKTEILIKSDIKLKSFFSSIFILFIHIILFIFSFYHKTNINIFNVLLFINIFVLDIFVFTLFTGKEIIIISPKSISITQKILFFKRRSSYEINKIKNLRSIEKRYPATKKGNLKKLWHMVLMKNGIITFDYMNKEIAFGSWLDVDQGSYVIENYLKDLKRSTYV